MSKHELLYTPEMAGSGQFAKCAKCLKFPTAEGHDGCMGALPDPDVMNACCGHGNSKQAYVQFWDKPKITGLAANIYIEENKEVL